LGGANLPPLSPTPEVIEI